MRSSNYISSNYIFIISELLTEMGKLPQVYSQYNFIIGMCLIVYIGGNFLPLLSLANKIRDSE